MSNHLKQFGKVVRSLRRDMFDYRNGRGWSREQLAERSGIVSPHAIGRIERGQQTQLDAKILLGLANAFNLTTASRQRFFLASSVPMSTIANPNVVCKQVFETSLEQMQTNRPAILHNAFYEIVAVNSAYLRFYALPKAFFEQSESDVLQYHHLRLMYDASSMVQHIVGERIEQGRFRTSAFWRYLALPYRYTRRYADIQAALEQLYTSFAESWTMLSEQLEAQDNADFERSVDYWHPEFGYVQYALATRTFYTQSGELFLSEHIPTDEETLRVFQELETVNQVVTLAVPFPELVPITQSQT